MSVEDHLKSALLSLKIDTKIYIAGRTDAGVHASRQVANFLIPHFWNNLSKLKNLLNTKIAPYIYIHTMTSVSKKFHSRFSAKRRLYRYLITTKSFNVFQSDYMLFTNSFDIQTIQQTSSILVGTHDFGFLCKSGSEPKSTIRTIYSIKIYSPKKDIFVISILGNSFLRSQVRLMVAFLLAISEKRATLDDLQNQLLKKSKINIKPVSGYGLYLSKIFYN